MKVEFKVEGTEAVLPAVVEQKPRGPGGGVDGDGGGTAPAVVKMEVEGTEAVLPHAVKQEPRGGGGGGGQKRAAEGIVGTVAQRARGGAVTAVGLARPAPQVKQEPGALDAAAAAAAAAATRATGSSKGEASAARPLRLGSLPTAGLGGLGALGGAGGRLMTLGRPGAGGVLALATKWR